MAYRNPILAYLLLLLLSVPVHGQEWLREEVDRLVAHNDSVHQNKPAQIVFTGSSSIRKWHNLNTDYPEVQILNTGFGGSQASDLLYFLEDLVGHYQPQKVFIYEGDNDIASRKKPKRVLADLKEIAFRLKTQQPQIRIVFISAKPSPSRWKYRRKYRRLNRKLAEYCSLDPQLQFVDVWQPMLDGRKPKTDIFANDRLHMNKNGYAIWKAVLAPFVRLNPIEKASKKETNLN
jgi:lysophospholipase L1-like esterase